ncbi:50S ribosomal protein L9 [bacterium]|nr:50S ribosomal protein L9 [bacterium]
MKVVLLDDIVNVGEAGELVEVKNGYARNYLIPQQLAERATKDVLNRIELIKRAAETKRARRMSEAAGRFAEVAGRPLVISMKAGTESRLFGAVTSAMIADEILRQFEVEIDRRHIMLEEPIKHLGEFIVPLKASADVTGEVKVVVEAESKPDDIERRLIEQDRADREAAEAETRAAAEAAENEEVAEAVEAVEAQDKYEAHEEEAEEPTAG